MNISILIQTHNEENNIEQCIESAKLLTDTIILVDMESTDNTFGIAQKFGVQLNSFPYSHYVEPAREFGIKLVKTEWVMILDADERMTKELAKEIKKVVGRQSLVVSKKENITHYKIPRKNMFGGTKWLRYGGWWPDEQIRLIQLSAFRSWPTAIHSTPQIDGKMGFLKEPFLHYFHGNLHHMVEKTLIFEDIESDLLYKAGKTVSTTTFFRKFFGELWRRLFKAKGFLDGEIGIIESIYQAFSKTITYLLLYEKKNSSSL